MKCFRKESVPFGAKFLSRSPTSNLKKGGCLFFLITKSLEYTLCFSEISNIIFVIKTDTPNLQCKSEYVVTGVPNLLMETMCSVNLVRITKSFFAFIRILILNQADCLGFLA